MTDRVAEVPSVGSQKVALKDLALVFLRLGTTAFGGPAAHIAMMEEEFVRRRKWVNHEEFLDLLGASNLIPGPSSTEMAIYLGRRLGGWCGLLIAGACFILPAMFMVLAIAWAYLRFHQLPVVGGIFYGIKPVVVAIVLQALWRLGEVAFRRRSMVLVFGSVVGLDALGVNQVLLLFGAGVAVVLVRQGLTRWKRPSVPLLSGFGGVPAAHSAAAAGTAAVGAAAAFTLPGLFLFFLKVGAVIYGSGYVLLAFLRADLVTHLHWLTEKQLIDAVAVGQVTPGPVFTTATFIGYLLGGWKGGLVATAGIFLPGFIFVALSGHLIPRLRKSPAAGAFLDGVNAAGLALMAVVTWDLGRAAVQDLLTAVMGLASVLVLFRFQWNSSWLILLGALIGLFVGMIR